MKIVVKSEDTGSINSDLRLINFSSHRECSILVLYWTTKSYSQLG